MKELFAHAEAGEDGVHQVVPDVPAVQLAQGLQRRLRSAVRIGTCLCYLGAAVGLFLTYYLISAGSYATLSPLYMLGFLALWLLPTLLLSGLVKHF